MKLARIVIGLLFLAVLASNVFAISRWSESRGVYDDVCYLRQAHLFQRFGLAGFDTDISKDDDRYLAGKLRDIGFAEWSDPMKAPCHTPIEKTQKYVLQYPPGTGAALALFPAGFQVIPLFVTANLVVLAFALVALFRAASPPSLALAAIFGLSALYLMINPTKASYSMAPTMIVCALAGFLTARLFVEMPQRRSLYLTMLIGFLIGLAVNFRLPNLFLSAGYFLFFGIAFLRSRKLEAFLQGGSFGVAYLAGIAPTLIANAINAGSPLTTTYGGDPSDLKPPTIEPGILWAYFTDLQGVLLILASAWVVLIFRRFGETGMRSVALVTALNLLVNVSFFMTHPTFNPYYAMPIAMLSLWSLLFAWLMRPAESGDRSFLGQAAKA